MTMDVGTESGVLPVQELVEREHELVTLRQAVDRATAGLGAVAFVTGPPGIGKTELVHAAERAAIRAASRGRDVLVLRARGGELEQEYPYGIMRQLFEAPLRSADQDTRAVLLDGPARPAGALLDGEFTGAPSDAAALEHAFHWLTINLAEHSAVVLLVDDAHWADFASLRALLYLARRVSDLPMALIVTARPTQGMRRSLMDRLAAESTFVLEPATLSEAGVEALLQRDLEAVDDVFSQACHSASGGNPFLVTELIDAVQASGIEPVAANAARVRTVSPRNVTRSVLLRLAALSQDATRVAKALAVLGECERIDILAQLAELPLQSVVAACDELRDAHIAASEQPQGFVHAIIRTAVYDDISSAQRSLMHANAAHLLADAGSSTDAVASHLLLTAPGSDPWVVQHMLTASSSGLALSTPETTAAYLARALQESVVTGADRVPLLLGLGGSRFQTADGGAVAPLLEALELATDPAMRMEVVRALAAAYMTERRYDECWALVDATLDEFSQHPDLGAEVEIYAAQPFYTQVEGALAQLPRVAAWRPDPAGAGRRDRSMLATQAWVAMCEPTDAEVARARARGALSSGTLISDDVWYVTFEMAIWPLIAAGCHDEALGHLNDAIEACRALGRMVRVASLLLIRAELQRRLGRLDLAEEDGRIAVDIVPREHVYAPQSASSLVFAMLDRGAVDDARQVLIAHGFADEIPDGGTADILWLARGRLRIAEGELAGGVEDVLRYGQISEMLHRRNPGYYPWRSIAARALVQLGHHEQALELANEECELAAAWNVPEVRARSLVALGTAQLGTDGIAILTEAVSALSESPFVLDLADAQLALGSALRRAGKREQAQSLLRIALDSAARIDAVPLADLARAELVACGARPRRAAVTGVDALTPSERRVASMAAQGLTNREIAHTLYVTPKTIEAHLAAVYRKLGVSGKANLSAFFADSDAEAAS